MRGAEVAACSTQAQKRSAMCVQLVLNESNARSWSTSQSMAHDTRLARRPEAFTRLMQLLIHRSPTAVMFKPGLLDGLDQR